MRRSVQAEKEKRSMQKKKPETHLIDLQCLYKMKQKGNGQNKLRLAQPISGVISETKKVSQPKCYIL